MKTRWQAWSLGVLLGTAGCVGVAGQLQTSGTALQIDPPSELVPMTTNAVLTQPSGEPGKTVAVLIGVRLLPGWHTYAYVPAEEPYVQTQWLLEPGTGLTAMGDWIAPPPVPDAQNPRMKLYQSGSQPLIFMHEFRIADNASGEIGVRTGLVFQTCNFIRCLPPTRKTFDLKLTVATQSQ